MKARTNTPFLYDVIFDFPVITLYKKQIGNRTKAIKYGGNDEDLIVLKL